MLRFSLPAVVLFLPGMAAAQTTQGVYIAGQAGPSFAGSLLSSGGTTNLSTNPGPAALAGIGWGFGNGLRAELEGSYRSNGIAGISTLRANGSLSPLTNTHGTVATDAVMADLAYDVPFHGFGLPVQPYIGAGLGYSRVHVDGGGDGVATFHLPGTIRLARDRASSALARPGRRPIR